MASGLKIVLVEDNHGMRQELVRALGALHGAQIAFEATTSEGAIHWLRENKDGWDVLIVDMFLAQGHGFDVLKICRDRPPHQKAVMLSNYAKDDVANHARRVGADRFFDKSLELDELLAYCKALAA